jgi:hypothetical protein
MTQLAHITTSRPTSTYLVRNLRALSRLGRLRKEDKGHRQDQEHGNDESLNRRHLGRNNCVTLNNWGKRAGFMGSPCAVEGKAVLKRGVCSREGNVALGR